MKIPCYFCQTELESNRIASSLYKAFCSTCPEITGTTYGLMDDGNIKFRSASITFTDGGKDYLAQYCPGFFYIDMIPTPFLDINGKILSKRVMQLSFSPKNITPHNIKQKFQTLKVWS